MAAMGMVAGAGVVEVSAGATVASRQPSKTAVRAGLRPAATAVPSSSASPSSSFSGTQLRIRTSSADRECQRHKAGALTVRAAARGTDGERTVRGPCFVVDDVAYFVHTLGLATDSILAMQNIDTDQIIPAEYLTLVPSKPDEYEKLGSYAMAGLPKKFGRYVEEGENKTKYPVMIGGQNFGCGSSREHAPVAMGASGCRVVVAESYARIFFRNCVATGELYPYETPIRLCDEIGTGHEVEVDLSRDVMINKTTGKEYQLSPLGEAKPVIDAGGIFNYARETGMI
eukprot:jgi/Chlat1/7823/Chrsp66S07334